MSTNYLKFKKDSPEMHELILWLDHLKAEGRGDSAELRRCSTLAEVVFTPAYHRLYQVLRRIGICDDNHLALVVGLAARVKGNDDGGSFAEQMASGKGDGSARVSGLRFRRLLKVNVPEDFYTAMIRIIALMGGKVNLQSLARSAYLWNDRFINIRKEWAFEYYAKAPSEE